MIIKMGFKHLNAFVFFIMVSAICGQYLNRKPWPTYSLQNMPRTSFSCHDKILGGYYADSETQCQMFHVCVKVAGVGVQDFRFLCPNGTAFDQEAQICADWGDVDCEQATLYYSSDNFDLYRIGSGFESKRAPLADEEEATFHLQRAETSDVRRSKQTIINQTARPEQQQQTYKENTERNFIQKQQPLSTYDDQFQYQPKKQKDPIIVQKPITTKKPYYQKPIENSQYNNRNNDYHEGLRNEDELLRGSHSSSFFNNHNNGKEEDLVDFNKSPSSTKRPVNRGRQRGRTQYKQNYDGVNSNIIPTPPTKTTTTFSYQEPRIITADQVKLRQPTKTSNSKTFTLQASFRTADLSQYQLQNSTVTPLPPSSTTQRYTFVPTKSPNQLNIQPTTYNPGYNFARTKSSSTNNFDDYKSSRSNFATQGQNSSNNFYNIQYEKAAEANPSQFNFNNNINNNNADNNDFNRIQSTTLNYHNVAQKTSTTLSYNNLIQKTPTTTFGKSQNVSESQQQKLQPISNRSHDQFSRQSSPAKVTANQNYVNNYIPNTSTLPLTVRPLEARRVNAGLTNQTNYNPNATQIQNNNYNQQQYYNSQSNYRASPTPFAKPTPSPNNYQNEPSFSGPTPRGFGYDTTKSIGLTQSNNIRYQKVSRNNDNYTPPTTVKKFSTLVPKDQYYVTTFKPTSYNKNQANAYKNEKLQTNNNFAASSYIPTKSTTTTTAFPPPQTSEPDEDDGQYHPELYEKDFPRNKIRKNKQKPTLSSQRITNLNQYYQSNSQYNSQNPSRADYGEEDEFLRPEHSLNIAVGAANQLRASEKAEKSKQSSPKISTTTRIQHQTTTSSPHPPVKASQGSKKSAKKPAAHRDEDASYDYAYYDTGSENPHDYAEYDVISEFGKTKKQ